MHAGQSAIHSKRSANCVYYIWGSYNAYHVVCHKLTRARQGACSFETFSYACCLGTWNLLEKDQRVT